MQEDYLQLLATLQPKIDKDIAKCLTLATSSLAR